MVFFDRDLFSLSSVGVIHAESVGNKMATRVLVRLLDILVFFLLANLALETSGPGIRASAKRFLPALQLVLIDL